MNYHDFLAQKCTLAPSTGIDVSIEVEEVGA